jgi:hypothetical protein
LSKQLRPDSAGPHVRRAAAFVIQAILLTGMAFGLLAICKMVLPGEELKNSQN